MWRTVAADTILSGKWGEAHQGSPPPVQGMDEYWKEIFESPSASDMRKAPTPSTVAWSVLAPITPDEVSSAIA